MGGHHGLVSSDRLDGELLPLGTLQVVYPLNHVGSCYTRIHTDFYTACKYLLFMGILQVQIHWIEIGDE